MVKIRTTGKSHSPLFRKGDLVSFLFGAGSVTGQIVEDRGQLGVGGRRLILDLERLQQMLERILEAGSWDELTVQPSGR
jgi:hypothetical protein